MKRTFAWLLTVCAVISMVACGAKQGNSKENSSTPTETTVAPTSAPTDVPTEFSTETATETSAKATDTKQTAETIINDSLAPRPTATKLTRPTSVITKPTWSLCSYPTAQPTTAPTKGPATVPTTAPTIAPTTVHSSEPSKEPLRQKKPPYDDLRDEYDSYEQICNRFGTAWDSNVSLDVPIYYEEEILGSAPHYRLSKDSSFTLTLPGEFGNRSIEQFLRFPSYAIRQRLDSSSYLVYDTETDYRLYIFVTDDSYSLMGYPIVINKDKMLSHDDFNGIQIGDAIEKVVSVDDIMVLYKKELYGGYYVPVVFESRKEDNNPVVSVHYLTDGILRIEYAMPEEGSIVVANVEFFEDYMIPTADGKLTSHKIKDIDLPVS